MPTRATRRLELRVGILLTWALTFANASEALAVSVTIGNGPSTQSGDYINAIDIANTMAFTGVTIVGDTTVTVADPSDLSVSPLFGPTPFDLFLQAPVRIDVLEDLKMGAGSVSLTTPTLRLSGVLRGSDGTPLDQTRLASPAQQIEFGVGGSVEQASLLASENSGNAVHVTVDGASDPGLISVWDDILLELKSGFVENVTLLAAGSRFEWRGGQLGETGLFGFAGQIDV